MKKNLALIVLFLSLTSFAFAQKDAKAKEWLDKSSEAFAKAGDLSVSFTMNIKDVANQMSESFDGTIDIKGNKFHLDVPEMESWFDGKTQWVLQKGWDEVNISEPNPQEVQVLNPKTIFDMYKKGTNYKYLGETMDIKGRKVHEVELIPQAKNSEIKKITMQISPIDYMPVKIHITYKNKIENIIHITQYKKNANLADSLFVFDSKQYPEAEIIDLR
jgi:outer membrane lipoprotein-sorting protein